MYTSASALTDVGITSASALADVSTVGLVYKPRLLYASAVILSDTYGEALNLLRLFGLSVKLLCNAVGGSRCPRVIVFGCVLALFYAAAFAILLLACWNVLATRLAGSIWSQRQCLDPCCLDQARSGST